MKEARRGGGFLEHDNTIVYRGGSNRLERVLGAALHVGRRRHYSRAGAIQHEQVVIVVGSAERVCPVQISWVAGGDGNGVKQHASAKVVDRAAGRESIWAAVNKVTLETTGCTSVLIAL